ASSTLTIAGVISDLGSGQNLTKAGAGTVVLGRDNTYRGQTNVNNGILTIKAPLALGVGPGLNGNGTAIVNKTLTETGTLQLACPPFTTAEPGGLLQAPTQPFNPATNPYLGFVVLNESVTLNGAGFSGQGALANAAGNNNWAGPVPLGSPKPGGAAVAVG